MLVEYTGKVPQRTGGALAARQNIKKMKRQLEAYITKEEYENAARLRDEIRSLERELEEQEKGGKTCQ
jgi:protein arginine kinase activator